MNFSIKIKNRAVVDYLFIIMTICICIAPNTLIGYMGIIAFLFYIILQALKKGLYLSPYILLEFLFPAYMILQLAVVDIYSESMQFSGIRTLLITCIFNICIYNYIIQKGIDYAAEEYSLGIIIGSIILCVLYSGSIINNGGLSAEDFKGISFFKIGGVAAVNIGWLNAIAIVLLWQRYIRTKNKNCLVKILILTFILLLTGRRKIMLFLVSSVIIGSYLFYSKGNWSKKIKILFYIGILFAVVCIMFTQIPVLYNFIGQRLIYAVKYILGQDGIYDSSIKLRTYLAGTAQDAWHKSPIWGQGYNSFAVLYNSKGYYSHNNMLELLVTGGITGIIVYYLPYLYLLIAIFTKTRKETVNKWYYKYWFLNIVVFIILEYFQVTYIYRNLTIFLVFMAVAADKNYVVDN